MITADKDNEVLCMLYGFCKNSDAELTKKTPYRPGRRSDITSFVGSNQTLILNWRNCSKPILIPNWRKKVKEMAMSYRFCLITTTIFLARANHEKQHANHICGQSRR